ncbi:MAG: phenylalanine--tRNA ligase subunit beta [Capsulimonadales bacterium]|nr:phenylalanine--tRNA ligase subunit beta [Capsulimonadales bacterium]
MPEDGPALEAFCDKLTMVGLEVEEILETPVGPTLYTKITPNRGDWASVFGTAREAAAALSLPAPRHAPAPLETGPWQKGEDQPTVTIEDADHCPRYAAKILRGVKIGPTPQWLQDRLSAALGEKYRPINNVADITNYVMLELGQPLHAFDLDTLAGRQVIVRPARPGETIKTLDQLEEETPRKLLPGMLCICDRDRPIAIAGIMGGAETEISDRTVNILLESAHFDPLSVRRTSKRLGLKTEASYRFERYVDPTLVPIAAERAARLIVECAGGEALPGLIDVVARKTPPGRVLARMDRIRELLGADVDREEAISALERLGLIVERSANALDCGIPSWRPDLTIEDDIAEEVGRIALGYENLPATPPPVLNPQGSDSPLGRFKNAVRRSLVESGWQELHTHSLVAPSAVFLPEETDHRIFLRAPLAPEYAVLRTSLLPNLMATAARAFRDGLRDGAIFEVGAVYRTTDGGFEEPVRIAGLCAGSAMPAAWSIKPDALPADFYFVKGTVEDLLHRLGIEGAVFTRGAIPGTHPGRTATVLLGEEAIGFVGELSEQTVEAHDLPRRTYVFDLDGEVLMRRAGDIRIGWTQVPKFPAIVRDLAPVFGSEIDFGTIEKAAITAAGPLLESFRLTDVYTGANLPEGKRSLTLRFTFRSSERTLKDSDVDAALAAVRQALTTLGGDFRGA